MFEHALPATATALNIASALNDFIKTKSVDEHFSVTTVDGESRHTEFWVRPMLEQDLLPLADNTQLVKCIELDGRRIDIFLPPKAKINDAPAMILLGEELPQQG